MANYRLKQILKISLYILYFFPPGKYFQENLILYIFIQTIITNFWRIKKDSILQVKIINYLKFYTFLMMLHSNANDEVGIIKEHRIIQLWLKTQKWFPESTDYVIMISHWTVVQVQSRKACYCCQNKNKFQQGN